MTLLTRQICDWPMLRKEATSNCPPEPSHEGLKLAEQSPMRSGKIAILLESDALDVIVRDRNRVAVSPSAAVLQNTDGHIEATSGRAPGGVAVGVSKGFSLWAPCVKKKCGAFFVYTCIVPPPPRESQELLLNTRNHFRVLQTIATVLPISFKVLHNYRRNVSSFSR